MSDALRPLADLGAWSVWGLWAPLAAWSALVLVAEGLLQRARPHVALRYPLRRALVWALPLAVVLPPLLAALWPPAPATAWPEALVLPTLSVPLLAEAPTPRALPWPRLLAGLGVLALALAGLVEVARVSWALLGLRWRAPQPSPERAALLRRLRKDEGVPRGVRLAACPLATVPYTSGWPRPLVVFPEALLADTDGLRLALRHELAHVMQRDFAHALAERLALAPLAAWFPPARLLLRGLALDRECLCDAEVLAREPCSRGAYARLLLAFADWPAPAPLLTVPFFTTHLAHRLDAMARPLSPPRHARFAGSALAGLVLAGVLLFSLASAAPTLAQGTGEPSVHVEARGFPLDQFTKMEERLSQAKEDLLNAPSLRGYGNRPPTDDDPDWVMTLTFSANTSQAEVERIIARELARTDEVTRLDYYIGGDPVQTRRIRPAGSVPRRAPDPTVPPSIVGGPAALSRALAYPEAARAQGIAAGVVLGLTVQPDGSVANLRVLSPGHPLLDEAAVQAVQSIRFEPATRDGQPVPYDLALPISFRFPADPDAESPTPRPAPRPADPSTVFEVAEQDPVLIGGLEGLHGRIRYPEAAREAGIRGTVFVQFVVDEQGVPTDIQIVRSPNAALNDAALQAIREARFTPGRQRGQPVKVRFTLPIRFALPTE